jgi:hypothetical protein
VERDAEAGAGWLARLGLGGRGGFYLLLAYLTLRLAISGSAPRQSNANGAMATVAKSVAGRAVLGAIALGLFCFGVESLVAAWRDREGGGTRRGFAAARGVFYLGLSYVPSSFLSGDNQVGSEQQQRKTTGRLLGLAFGQELVFAIGIAVVGICGWQIYTAVRKDPIDRLELGGEPAWLVSAIRKLASIGIVARAATVLPVGVFFMVAAAQFDPNHAKGLDGELAALARNDGGRAVLLIIATGLLVFSLYSLVEARYRNPERD